MKLGNVLTDICPVNFGVKQGCIMSPSLFSIYVNELAEDIRALNIDIDIDDLNVSISLHADDTALIAPDEKSLKYVKLYSFFVYEMENDFKHVK